VSSDGSWDVALFENFRLDRRLNSLSRRDLDGSFVPVTIGSRALDILIVFVTHPGELVSRSGIMDAVWPGVVVDDSNLTVQLAALRKLLDADRTEGSCIQTVTGRGYRFTPLVTYDGPSNGLISDQGAGPVTGATSSNTAARWRRLAIISGLLLFLVVSVGWVAAGPKIWNSIGGRAARPTLSIIVLPFANLSGDPDQEYFADAITDDLTTDLSRIAGSVVIAHSTARTYRQPDIDVRQIGHDLGIRYVLEGSVRRMGDQVEVNAQLIDAANAIHLWAERFQTDRRDVAAAQSEITGRLARTLNLELVGIEGRRLERSRDADPGASDLVMRGWDLWFRPLSASTHAAAEQAFERALQMDPRSVDAKIGAATILISNIGTGLSTSVAQDGARARQLLMEALEQDADSSRAYEALGTLSRNQNHLEESQIELEKAVALDRNNAHALLQLGETLMFLGRPSDGKQMIERSIRLDPRDPNAAFGDWALGACELLVGHANEAAELLLRARAENPRVYYFQLYLAGALGLRGDVDEARVVLASSLQLKPAANSLSAWTAIQPWIGNPPFMALRAKTLDEGLRRAGMPDH
jgi:TolB-like protein/DNA-binding winged helix-turn-helix (wHTH) protein/Tfp pilus assembly protein PilF